MARVGSGFKGSPELLNSDEGNYEIIPQPESSNDKRYLFYKFEFICKENKEVTVQINNGEPIVLWNGYFSTDRSDAEIHSFKIATPNVDFYWYGAY